MSLNTRERTITRDFTPNQNFTRAVRRMSNEKFVCYELVKKVGNRCAYRKSPKGYVDEIAAIAWLA